MSRGGPGRPSARSTCVIPIVSEMHGWAGFNISGELRVLYCPPAMTSNPLRLTRPKPALVWSNLVILQCHRLPDPQSPPPRPEELTKRATIEKDGVLLLHLMSADKPGDVDHFLRSFAPQGLGPAATTTGDRILLAPAAGDAHGWPAC